MEWVALLGVILCSLVLAGNFVCELWHLLSRSIYNIFGISSLTASLLTTSKKRCIHIKIEWLGVIGRRSTEIIWEMNEKDQRERTTCVCVCSFVIRDYRLQGSGKMGWRLLIPFFQWCCYSQCSFSCNCYFIFSLM